MCREFAGERSRRNCAPAQLLQIDFTNATSSWRKRRTAYGPSLISGPPSSHGTPIPNLVRGLWLFVNLITNWFVKSRETLSALLSKLKNYGFDQLVSQLTPSSRREAWVPGNLSAPTGRSQPATRWTRGRGGESCVLRLFPWRTLKIYLFGTMITGLLLIGLGFALGYRRIQKTGTAVQSTRLPVMIEAVGRAVSIETETINRNMDSIMEKPMLLRSSPFYRHLLITNYYTYTHIHTYIKICIHLPTPDPSPPSLWTASLTSGSVTSAGNGCGSGWLLAGARLLPLLQSRVSMVYYVLLLLMCFSCSHTVLPKEHSLFVFFSPHLPRVMLYFSSIPCLPVLSTPLLYMYVVYVWTGGWLISLVLVTSDK